MEALLLVLGGAGLILGVIIYGGFVGGFVLLKFYQWFLLSSFTQLPTVTYMQCVAVCMFLVAIKPSGNSYIKNEYKESSAYQVTVAAIQPWLILIVGWAFKSLFF
jgi:hypothetical protein